MKTAVAIVDDHYLMAQALAELIRRFNEYDVIFCAQSGRELQLQLDGKAKPEIVILDVHMADMSGQDIAGYLRQNYPDIKVLALSMMDDEQTIAQMIQQGARGYLLKGCRPSELRLALDDIRTKGYHYSDFLTKSLINQLNQPALAETKPLLNQRERDFIRLACSELIYVEIADKMCVSPRTVDGYRETVFEKLGVKSRQGLVMEAMRRGLI
ncbi:response regulator [Fibrella aquatilis]|uniref:Response regulator transcription factor n=1 Tax=Fibrella aquatilis TaxID=2817059 RepID=A0A939K1D5_9BACT|nr:response regulator transcription factor [Fibrella aquatilis]MBO0932155.1 response regulator transcription factor [Fibrella aquatilis]